MYQLITIDMDDTLLNSQGTISEENKTAIQKAENAGVRVIVASGRSYASAKQYIKELELSNLTVSLNGAYIHDSFDGRLVAGCPVEKSIVQEIIKDIEPFHVYTNFSCGEKIFFQGSSEWASLYRRLNGKEIDYIEDSLVKLSKTEQVGKVLMGDEPEKLEPIRDLLWQKYKDRVNIAFSKPFFLEVTDKRASKGAAMLKVAELYGIKPEEIIAIGDSENDLSMIKSAGLGIAVANAIEKVKREADFVTLSNNDNGVAYAVNKFIFHEN